MTSHHLDWAALPDQDIEDARLAANIGFTAAAGAAASASVVPIIGDAITAGATTAIAHAQTIANYHFDLRQVNAQREAATAAVNNPEYNTEVWGEIVEKSRDLVVIEDFQIGVDNIFLPSVSNIEVDNVNNIGYAIKSGLNNERGVFIEAQIGGENSNLVFIENHYDGLSNTDFLDQISNLLVSQPDGGSIIGTFNETPVRVTPFGFGAKQQEGTFAGDHIIGQQLSPLARSVPGSFELIGEFGDDWIQGSSEGDILHGGFNIDQSLTVGIFIHEDDGFDILQGGKGDDLLKGGSGNDTLDGGGFTYDDDLNVTGVIVGDGTDTLTGGSGNDTFVFNTPDTGIDVITDFTVFVDKIQINRDNFGATDPSEFSFDPTNGALSFGSEQFAILENNFDVQNQNLQNFDVNRDIQLVSPSDIQLV